MSLDLLIIIGSCVAGVVFGLLVYWLIFSIQKTLRSKYKVKYSPDTQRKTDTEIEVDNWLNYGVSKVSTSTIFKEDDDWLNAGVEKLPTYLDKQQDDDWLNAENNQPLETVDESSLNRSTTNHREFHIKQDGSIFHILVTAVNKQDTKPEQTVINLKINASPNDSTRQGEWSYDIERTPDGSAPSFLSLQDIITIKPAEEPVNQSYALLDEISVRTVESRVIESHALLDEISIRHVENQITKSHVLFDEISVRHVESRIAESHTPLDEIVLRPVEIPITTSHVLLDEIAIKPSPGPVNIEYELLDDLITKTALYRTRKEKLLSDAIVTKALERAVEIVAPEKNISMPEAAKTISMHEITKILNEERNLKKATITSAVTGTRKIPTLSLDIPIIATRFKVLLLSLVYLLGMAVAELIIYRTYPIGGIVFYFIILFSLIVSSISAKVKSERNFYIALGLAPLIRIVLLAVPGILLISQYLWYIVASIPIIAGIISISRIINLNINDIGLNFNKPFIQFLVAIAGIGLAMVDFLILQPAAWTSTFTIQETLLPAIVLLIFTGLIEELSFRGVMQRASVAVWSYGWILIAAVYAVLQIWQGSVFHCVFCFGVSLLFGWIVKKTRSILGVSVAHGFINIGLYLVLPHIF